MWVRIIDLSSGTKTDIWSMTTHVRQQARMNFAMKMWITNHHSELIAANKVKNWIAFSICKQKLLRTALTNVGLIWNESTNRFHAIGYIWGNGVIHKFHQITHSIFPPKVKHVSTRPTCTAGATYCIFDIYNSERLGREINLNQGAEWRWKRRLFLPRTVNSRWMNYCKTWHLMSVTQPE